MPLHPTPPRDLDELVEGFRQTVQAVIDLGHGCTPEQFAEPTSCPGWSVLDHVSHIAAVEHYLDGGDHPDVEVSGLEHVRHEFAAWMEQGVQARRGTSGPEVVAELETLLHNRLATLADPDLTLDTEVRAPMDSTMRLSSLLRLRLTDIWTHEQDIREALGRIGDLDTPAAATFVNALVRSFGQLMHAVPMADGQTVILESTGPVTARMGVRVSHDETGEVTYHSLFTGESESGMGEAVHSGEDPSTTISLSTEALTRRAAGRRTTGDTTYSVVGDEDLAVRVLDAITFTP
ncbi:maleylpyruvate isomerase family mycothiol-dependent enzyme [Ornithinimicrobium sp. F0845]|uniref:maleylpyruvate isomerase family mycothiol-dependent enzyme n=1 Tax=Ornithinimicrobium sp. F0845 TaxID=2926412 RepID=UPI001FF481AA|nr:maleylpyruvate isomerase family mycothiol-dependent enzyme [Ornithinimicrobium sp. F0845]MCK0112090.1 maleylpyruvate isomerase family mycothiol-dependent enzyme [Ornithinimicrobium sp. F0845]